LKSTRLSFLLEVNQKSLLYLAIDSLVNRNFDQDLLGFFPFTVVLQLLWGLFVPDYTHPVSVAYPAVLRKLDLVPFLEAFGSSGLLRLDNLRNPSVPLEQLEKCEETKQLRIALDVQDVDELELLEGELRQHERKLKG